MPIQLSAVLAVVVVNYAAAGLLEQNLGRICAPGGADPAVRFVVVDNFSSVGEQGRVRELADRFGWQVVARPDNGGFGAGVNAGVEAARAAGCGHVLILNPDAWISSEGLDALWEQSRAEPMTAISPRIEASNGRVVYKGSQVSKRTGRIKGLGPFASGASVRLDGPLNAQLPGPTQGWLTGACMALSLELFDRVGGFEESYFLYWEDIDLSARIEAAGGHLVVRLDQVAVHDEGGTQVLAHGQVRSSTYYYYNCRNRLRFAADNLSRTDVLRWVLHTPAESWQILLRGGRRQLLTSPRPLWAVLRGSAGGVRLALAALFRPARERRSYSRSA